MDHSITNATGTARQAEETQPRTDIPDRLCDYAAGSGARVYAMLHNDINRAW